MFCSGCGTKGTGRFCTACGRRLPNAGASGATSREAAPPPEDDAACDGTVVLSFDWSDLIDYEQLISIPAVRDRIARAAARSKKGISGEEILDLYGKLTGVPLPLSKLAGVAQSAYAKLGVKTGKSRSGAFAVPAGEMLVRLLCSLAKEGREVRGVHQLSDGCIVNAALPSDLWALEGDLLVSITRAGAGSRVEAATDIPGQLFDWGKSTRCLEGLLTELGTAAAA
jgi:hypothetical protein